MGHSYTCLRPEIFIKKPVVWEDKDTLVSVLMEFSSKAVFSPDEEFDSEDGLTLENIFGGIAGATIYIHPYYLAETLSEHMEEGEAWVYVSAQGEDCNSWSNTWRIVPGKVDEFEGKSKFESVERGEDPEENDEEDDGSIRIRCTNGPCAGAVYTIGSNDEVVIGRDPAEAHIVIESLEVSRKHALIRIFALEGMPEEMPVIWVPKVRDLGSTNGTFLLDADGTTVERVGSEFTTWAPWKKLVLGKGPEAIAFKEVRKE